MTARIIALLALATTLFACADAQPADDSTEMSEAPTGTEADAPEASVTIASPAAGDTVAAGAVEVILTASALAIVPAGDSTANSGHHHLFLDADISPLGEPIPAVEGSIVHMGDGSASFTFEDVAPGEHRVIAVVGDWQHVPLEPLVTDTVVFIAR